MAEENNLPDDPEKLKAIIADLRKEAAGHRTKASAAEKRAATYEQAFDGFDDDERAYLLDRIDMLGGDVEQGAIAFRDMAQQLLQDKFFEGLELPAAEKDEKEETKDEDNEEEQTVAGLTMEQLKAELDRREQEARAQQENAATEAEIEKVYAVIEAAGFPRGSRGFRLMLEEAHAKITADPALELGAVVDERKADIRAAAKALGEELPEPEGSADAGEEGDAPVFPTSADISGGGQAPTDGDGSTDWAAKAAAEGASVTQMRMTARERLEQRLGA